MIVHRQPYAIFVSVKITDISAAIGRRLGGGESPQVAADQLLSAMPDPFRTRVLSYSSWYRELCPDGVPSGSAALSR